MILINELVILVIELVILLNELVILLNELVILLNELVILLNTPFLSTLACHIKVFNELCLAFGQQSRLLLTTD